MECSTIILLILTNADFDFFFFERTMQSLRGSIRLVRRQCSNNVDLKSNGSHFATATAKFYGSSIGFSNPCFLGSISKFVCILTHRTLMYYNLQHDFFFFFLVLIYLFIYLLVYWLVLYKLRIMGTSWKNWTLL